MDVGEKIYHMFKWFYGLFDRVFAVIGAVVLLQAPQFFQQYSQRLSGHIDELKFHINAIQRIADKNGKGILEYIEKFLEQTDHDFISQGKMMQTMLDRHAELTNALLALKSATPFTRPYYFAKNFHLNITQATFQDFQPGLMLTIEGIFYAIFGLVIGVCIYHILLFILSRLSGFLRSIIARIILKISPS
jgi:hypothetical protein